MKFNSSYSPAPSFSEPSCPTEVQNYKYDEVSRKLIKTDKIPFYKEIQSYYESTKLSDKLTRYTMGDVTALGFESNNYFDISGQNTNLAQVLNTNQIAKGEFSKLPSDVKQLFNGDFTEFIRCIENGTFEQRLVEYAKSKSAGAGSAGSDDSNA